MIDLSIADMGFLEWEKKICKYYLSDHSSYKMNFAHFCQRLRITKYFRTKQW
jgi:hypothetical protein